LRREELADLAGVGLTWYTWLEQGRDIRVSSEVLNRIATALRLESAERIHLFRLAGHEPPARESAAEVLSPRLRRVLDAWDPYPAHITGRRRDLVGFNRASELVHMWSQLPVDRQNVLWALFMLPMARRLHPDWEQQVPVAVAALRAEAGRDLGDPDYQALINELVRGSPEFAALWARHDVRGRLEGSKLYDQPQLGRLEFEYTPFEITEQPSLHLYLFTPADKNTETKVRAAMEMPAPDANLSVAAHPTAEHNRAAVEVSVDD
jgi:transcriptional regulator with XRE-family HTH domain